MALSQGRLSTTPGHVGNRGTNELQVCPCRVPEGHTGSSMQPWPHMSNPSPSQSEAGISLAPRGRYLGLAGAPKVVSQAECPGRLGHASPGPGVKNFLRLPQRLGEGRKQRALAVPLTTDVHVQLMNISAAIYLSQYHPAAGARDPRWINIATG